MDSHSLGKAKGSRIHWEEEDFVGTLSIAEREVGREVVECIEIGGGMLGREVERERVEEFEQSSKGKERFDFDSEREVVEVEIEIEEFQGNHLILVVVVVA